MTRRATILPAATQDLEEIALYLRKDNEAISDRFIRTVDDVIRQLLDTPMMGRQRNSKNNRLIDLRIWPISGFTNYLIFYRPLTEGIEIIRVLHGARDLATLLDVE